MRLTSMLRVLVGVATITSAGCSRKLDQAQADQETLATVGTLADEMCACKDQPCADRVTAKLTRWSETVAPGYKPSEATTTRLSSILQRLSACMAALVRSKPTPATPATSATPATPATPAPVSPPHAATDIIRAAKTWVSAAHPNLPLQRLDISYVDEHGVLDPEHGRIEFAFTPVVSDADPARKLGAPLGTLNQRWSSSPHPRSREHGRQLPRYVE